MLGNTAINKEFRNIYSKSSYMSSRSLQPMYLRKRRLDEEKKQKTNTGSIYFLCYLLNVFVVVLTMKFSYDAIMFTSFMVLNTWYILYRFVSSFLGTIFDYRRFCARVCCAINCWLILYTYAKVIIAGFNGTFTNFWFTIGLVSSEIFRLYSLDV